MHYSLFTGMSAGGKFGGPETLLIRGGVVRIIEDVSPFVLKAVDNDALDKVYARYESVHSRVDAAFPCRNVGRSRPLQFMSLSLCTCCSR